MCRRPGGKPRRPGTGVGAGQGAGTAFHCKPGRYVSRKLPVCSAGVAGAETLTYVYKVKEEKGTAGGEGAGGKERRGWSS